MHSARINEQARKVILPQLGFYIFTCPLTEDLNCFDIWIMHWLHNEVDGSQLSNI